MYKAKLITLIVILVLAIVACDTDEPQPTATPVLEPVVEPIAEPDPVSPLENMEFVVDEDLVNVTWEWEQRTTNLGEEVLITVPSPEDYLLIFKPDATFNAKLDCNNGSGAYATDGSGNIFMELGPMTRAMCPEESLSDEMINMFGPAQSYVYEENGNVVIFKWVAGGPWDYYRKAGTSAIVTDEALIGVIWSLNALNGESLVPTTHISAEFAEDGRVGGSAGCNNYSAPYQADGVNIEIGMGPITMMLCPEPIMVQESAYLGALAAASTYDATDDSLTLFDSSGEAVAVFGVESQGLAGTSWEVISYNNGRGGVQSVIIDTEITANFDEEDQIVGSAG